MKTPEKQIRDIINDADKAFDKHGFSASNRLYLKENARCEFLKAALKAAFETIEHEKGMRVATEEFYKLVLGHFKLS